MLETFKNLTGSAPYVFWLVLASAAVILTVFIVRGREKKRRIDKNRQDGLKVAVTLLDQREQFEWTYNSGRYRHRKSIPRTLDTALMTAKERARRDNSIGEFSPEGCYLEPPERSWD